MTRDAMIARGADADPLLRSARRARARAAESAAISNTVSSSSSMSSSAPASTKAVRTSKLRCSVSRHEKRLQALTKALFQSKILLPGSIVDSGAHKGGESCFYADLDPTRPVHAVEPLLRNVQVMRQKYSDRPNLLPLRGALGSTDRFVDMAPPRSAYAKRAVDSTRNSTMLVNVFQAPSAVNASSSSSTIFHVHRLDDLFAHHWAPERLAFAHFDVEGSELDVLAGANRTLRQDRPVFTVEVGDRRDANSKLLAMIASLGYRTYLVNEQCGYNLDCRNLICFPLERLPPASLLAGTVALTSLGALNAVLSLLPRRGRCAKAPRRERWLDAQNACTTADSGSVGLNGSQAASWDKTKDACSDICSRCARCRFFSFTRRWRDCSWFAHCDWDALRAEVNVQPWVYQRTYNTIFAAQRGLDTIS